MMSFYHKCQPEFTRSVGMGGCGTELIHVHSLSLSSYILKFANIQVRTVLPFTSLPDYSYLEIVLGINMLRLKSKFADSIPCFALWLHNVYMVFLTPKSGSVFLQNLTLKEFLTICVRLILLIKNNISMLKKVLGKTAFFFLFLIAHNININRKV